MEKSQKFQKAERSEPSFADSARGVADRLFRASAECIRQRERFARLVDVGTHDAEQQAAERMLSLLEAVS